KSLGANVVVDYTQEDFIDTVERYDLVVDIVASRSLADIRRVLRPKGRYVIVGAASMGKWFGLGRQVRTIATSPFVSQTLRPMLARRTQEDLEHVRQMAEAGQLVPVIDRDYPFEDSAAAIRHVQDGHARGKVVVTVA
ncbi:MAG: zinc-binding dehydrogenase, partial [Actinomycetes bacterium]